MSIWHDLKRFRTGRTLAGHELFSIPLTPDKEGMVGRECPQSDCQPRYFKIHVLAEEGEPVKEPEKKEVTGYLYCPYCGHKAHLNLFPTRDQVEWVKSMIVRDVHKSFDKMLRETIGSTRTTSRGGFFEVRLEYKPGILPSVRHYAEKELQRVVDCDQCGKRYAVYGIAMFCPWCGKGNLKVHLKRSIEVIKSLMDAHDQIVEKAGKESGYHLLGNCLEDCVSLFEGFLKVIYKQLLGQKYNSLQCSDKMAKLHNSFQNLSKARKIFKRDLSIDIFSTILPQELDFMGFQFAKRHVITHNLSLVDEKFKKQASTWQTSGQDISLDASDIARLLNLARKTIEPLIP